MLTPGRYVGAEEVEDDDEPFEEKMKRLVGDAERAVRGVAEAGEGHPGRIWRGLGYGG